MRALVVLVSVAFGCSSAPSSSSTAPRPVQASSAPSAVAGASAPQVPASPSTASGEDPLDAIAAWREGRPEPARREVRSFGEVGIAPIVVTRRGQGGSVTLQVIAVSDGATVDVRLRAEVRCKDSGEDGAPDFSVGGSIGELDASGKPDFTHSGLGGFGLNGKIVPNTPRDVVVAEALAGFPVGKGSVAWLDVGVISRCGQIDGQNVVVGLLPDGTPMLRPATERERSQWGAH